VLAALQQHGNPRVDLPQVVAGRGAAPRLQRRKLRADRACLGDSRWLTRRRIVRRMHEHAADHAVAVQAAVVQALLVAVVVLFRLEVRGAQHLAVLVAQAPEFRDVRASVIVSPAGD
jgi:hypothetical protein